MSASRRRRFGFGPVRLVAMEIHRCRSSSFSEQSERIEEIKGVKGESPSVFLHGSTERRMELAQHAPSPKGRAPAAQASPRAPPRISAPCCRARPETSGRDLTLSWNVCVTPNISSILKYQMTPTSGTKHSSRLNCLNLFNVFITAWHIQFLVNKQASLGNTKDIIES